MDSLNGAIADTGPFVAGRTSDVDAFLREATALGPLAAETPFQTAGWLRAWLSTLGKMRGVTPALISVRHGVTGEIALLLPFVVRRSLGVRVASFPDQSVTDYTAPILGPAAPRTKAAAQAACDAAFALLKDADAIVLDKLVAEINGRVNPLLLLNPKPSVGVRNLIALPETWDAFLAQRARSFRRSLGNHRRQFEQRAGAGHRLITDPSEALDVLKKLDGFQRSRLAELGEDFVLDRPGFAELFRELVRQGTQAGEIRVSVLEAEGQLIAASLCMLHGRSCTMTRIGNIGGEWARYSPGTLLAADTIRWAIESGYTTFDFGIGDYSYKRQFGCEQKALFTVDAPLRSMGRAFIALRQGANALRRVPHAKAFLTKFRRVKNGTAARRSHT